MNYRIEKDSMGIVNVPEHAFWGAQTERSRQNFHIGEETMPIELIYAITLIKKAAALANVATGKMEKEKGEQIAKAADSILSGSMDQHFPLLVWQTGSGTQTNMNVNEVIAYLADQYNLKEKIHPNDHVNMSQSSNDVFPAAIHVAGVKLISEGLLPVIFELTAVFKELEDKNQSRQ